ncbi:S8 family serine peptidase [Neotamlana laminarinivorans]|uniref:S8 family serine peptidase n=1 Tax=Neotamlana laminarinivorans TaxID=2883124 RepID=A0A9X1I4S9_9FLAO|nr:S8 family serine peptidase [Tamlana laminarinivorans]MCB4800192.1 S8 family serine peptidase [Tamlana laminarinivorans]
MKFLVLILFVCPSFLFSQNEDAWVFLTDKENVEASIANPISILTQKAIDKKQRFNITIDARDVPVNENYITQIKAQTGIAVLAKSKWFNAVHVRGSETDIKALAVLSFVDSIDFADDNLNTSKSVADKIVNKFEGIKTTFNYGSATNQIEMISGDNLHLDDFTGSGITIAIFDSGFPNVNTMGGFERLRNAGNILDVYDFVNRDTDVYNAEQHYHGTLVLSTMAGYIENSYVGTAPDASYYLFITEDVSSETPAEESYWVEAAERADSLGVDIINTSLGYKVFDNASYTYTDAEMNGYTTFITRGANIAFEKGLLLITSAGNEGTDGITAPADSPNTLSIGAVNSNGNYASFSSVGSSIQPTQKPDVVAQGESSVLINTNNNISTASGTSFSSPILAGGIACLWQALPSKTPEEIMQLVRQSASQYATPDYFLGYGIPNLYNAYNLGLSVKNTSLTQLKVYPNPTSGKVYFSGINGETSITVFNVLGKFLGYYNFTSETETMDFSFLKSGVYFFKIEQDNSSRTIKFIKE